MTIPAIVRQLQRLVPSENFVWDVRQVGHNVFKVQFPTRNDLERLTVFGLCRVPNSTCELTFDSLNQNPDPTSTLQEVWLRVSRIPRPESRDLLALWAAGDLFGKTREIDMKFTRQHGVLRIRIGCLDHTKIPKIFPMLFKVGFFDLTFVVEEVVPPVGVDVDMGGSDRDDDDDADGDDDLGEDFREAVVKYYPDTMEAKEAPAAPAADQGGRPTSLLRRR